MLSDKVSVTQIGLPQADLRLIETVFKLSAELIQGYTLHTDKLELGADIFIVNADEAESLAQWKILRDKNKQATPIMVSADGQLTLDNGITLARPLSLKKLMAAFQSITSIDSTSQSVPVGKEAYRVLVVDDSYSVRKYMQHKLPELTKTSLAIQFADSGEAAMDMLKKQVYDLVFLDVVMPGIDGYQVCKWIKSEQPTYVVMLTSKKSPFDKVRGNMSGCDAYITKPPKDENLKKVLDKSLRSISYSQSTDALNSNISASSLAFNE